MTLSQWTILYIIDLLFWLWILHWGGAERLEGTFTSGLLVDIFAPRWSADGIKIFGWCILLGSTVLFIGGLFYPGIRLL